MTQQEIAKSKHESEEKHAKLQLLQKAKQETEDELRRRIATGT